MESYHHNHTIRYIAAICTIAGCIVLTGCIETMRVPFDLHRISVNRQPAKDGDIEAMYEFGAAHCCGAAPFYDNSEGTKWLCRAARAGHKQAMVDIAYWWKKDKDFLRAGPINSSAILPDNAVSYAWYTIAAQYGHPDAEDGLLEVKETLSPKGMQRARMYLAHYPDMPCEMH